MKRIISLIIITAILFCGCTKKPAPQEAQKTVSYAINTEFAQMSNKLSGYTAALNGMVIAFPIEYKEFVKTGWELSKSEVNYKLESGQYSTYQIVNNNVKTQVYIANLSDNVQKVDNCIVCGIASKQSQDLQVDLPAGVKLGKTDEAALIKTYGEPTERKTGVISYRESDLKSADFYIKDGKLAEVHYFNISNPNEVAFSDKAPPQVADYKDVTLTSSLQDFTFYLYGTTYTMPLPLSRMLKAGWIMAAKSCSSIPAGETLKDAVKITYANRTLTLSLKNVADYPTTPENCFVVAIESTTDVKLDMVLSSTIRVGSSKYSLENAFGKDNFTSIKKEKKHTYYVYSNKNHGTLTVTVSNSTDSITSIKVECN